MTVAEFQTWMTQHDRRPLVMGVLNVTPDSFSDGGRFAAVESAIAQAEKLAADGADMIDIGGESTRPGSQRIEPREQIRRILPVLEAAASRLPVAWSVDTRSSQVASAAINAGATVINDISAGRDDPPILRLAADRHLPIILMHMQGEPQTMQVNPHYGNVIEEVKSFFLDRMKAAQSAGVNSNQILLDPGIGFGKNINHNLTLIREMNRFTELGRPLVIGTSRKGFIGTISGEPQPNQRLFGTAATVAWSIANGADIVRVHDVEPMIKVLRVIRAIQKGAS
ncbi:MAG TPA: dihydropteroate synthase [Tepidisphaeraceae bacterium]|nr:dihydropteroate synthase [Tepidisphaeraceae bacterium]